MDAFCLRLLGSKAFGQQPSINDTSHVRRADLWISLFCSSTLRPSAQHQVGSGALMVTDPQVVSTKGDHPPRKRARTEDTTKKQDTAQSKLFAPFRALGLVTDHVPFVVQTRSFKGSTEGPRLHILTCLGRSWALWEGGKMTLLFVGEYGRLLIPPEDTRYFL